MKKVFRCDGGGADLSASGAVQLVCCRAEESAHWRRGRRQDRLPDHRLARQGRDQEDCGGYEKKYSTTLKDAISDACSGNYKRLAVAWVDLTDQIAQPEKIIEFTPPPGPPVLEAPTVGVEAKLVDGAAAATVSWEETRPIFCTESGYTLTATPEGADEPAESAEPDPDARRTRLKGSPTRHDVHVRAHTERHRRD